MSDTILVVEDEPEIREMLQFALRRAGFDIWSAESAEAALSQLDGRLPDALVIDWMLPGMSGLELARRLRRDEHTSALPLLMLTARGEEPDKLSGFESGVDDYVVKPFSPKELVARLKALLRRTGTSDDMLNHGALELDRRAHRVLYHGDPINLGPTEYRLLEIFMRDPDRAFERSQLLDLAWGRGTYIEERTVDVHILRLRRVLKPFGLDQAIETVRGVGYRFVSPDRGD